jgi:hypothetical protein
MARSAEKRSDDPADAGQRRTGARLALAAGIVALALSPLVAYLAASFDGAREPGSPAVWSVPGVALVVLYALVAPAGAFTAWGTAGSGRLPIAGAAVAAGADLAALAVLLAVRADEFVWGPGLLVFFALFLLPGALAALAVAPLRRAGP